MSTCACGKDIIFGKTAEGKIIPLDLQAPVYVDVSPAFEMGGQMQIARTKNAYVSHFSTCANANDFSRKKMRQKVSRS